MLYGAFLLDHIQVRFYMRTLLPLLLSIAASNRCRRRRYRYLRFLSLHRSQTWALPDSRASHSVGKLNDVEQLRAAWVRWHAGT